MKSITELARDSDLVQGICLEVRVPRTGRSTWHPMKPLQVLGKYGFEEPVNLSPGPKTLVFWNRSEIAFTREVDIPKAGWTVTSFWPSYCEEEPDGPTPGCRVYTRKLEILRQDPDAVL